MASSAPVTPATGAAPSWDLAEMGLQRCIDAVLRAVRDVDRLDGAGCLLLDDHAALRYVSASDAAGRVIELAEELTAEGPCADAFLSGEPVLVEDLRSDPRYRRTAGLLLGTPIRSVIAVPVVAHGRLVGSLDGYGAVPRRADQAAVDQLRPYAEEVGRLVGNALDAELDDALTVQIAAGLEQAAVVDRAVGVLVAHEDGGRVAAARQLRQVAAALGVGVAAVSRHIVQTGQPPSPHPLTPLTDYRFSSVVQHLKSTVIAVFATDLRYLLVAGGAAGGGEWARRRLEGRAVRDTVRAEQAAWMEPLFRRALAGAVEGVADYQSEVDGRWYALQVAPVTDRLGVIAAGMLIAQDVTEVHVAAEELRVLRHRFETAFANAPTGMAMVQPDGRVMDLNEHLGQILGRPREQLLDADLFQFIHPDDRQEARRIWNETLEVTGRQRSQERRYVQPDGRCIWVNAHHVLVGDGTDHEQHVVVQCQDVTARRNAEEDLRRLVLLDPLTGLGNRTLMHDRLAHALDRTRRHPARLALVYLDLDRFKVINDSLGHDVGDEVLAAVGERLRSTVRPQDTVARLGGDEFAVLCEDVSGELEAREIAERLAAAASGPLYLRPRANLPSLEPVVVEASVGVIVANAEHEGPIDLLRDADLAMYAAKAGGRGRVEMHTKGMRLRATRRQQLETALRAAVQAGQVDVAYQPILRLADGAVVGLEALARWNDPMHGCVSPAEFIPIAEETGIIVPLGSLVLRRACDQVAQWRRDDPRHSALELSVNVSARQLVHPDFFDMLRAVTSESNGSPQSLTLEITESTLMESAGPAMAAIGELKSAFGVSIAIDDFGTGYSSLAYLTRLPIDGVKVDRGFVNGLGGANAQDTAVVRAVLSLADNLGLRVIAEGVETVEQENHLLQLACQYAQGFRFAKPLTATQARAWLAGASTASASGHGHVAGRLAGSEPTS